MYTRIYSFILNAVRLGLYNLIIEFTVIVNQWKNKYFSDLKFPNPKMFLDLTPTMDIDEDGVYDKALKWALENPDVTNIAVTGTYGSGKSSLIKKFIKNHCEYKFLKITLASFKESFGSHYISHDQARQIEFSILQQMFYTEKGDKLRDSRFKRINNLKQRNIYTKALLFTIWIISGLICFHPNFYSSSIFNDFSNDKFLQYAAIPVFLIGIIYLINISIRIFNNSKFSGLNLKDGGIELTPTLEQSILNKHIEEILYLFEVTDYSIVVFEDIDRFESTEIFTKLREINILLNQSKHIRRRIIFIYAIKDDKFNSADRTKFFDFILPIVPVINFHNSGSVLFNYFNKHFINHQISNNFLEDISLFINDMRLLKNIINEFSIYYTKLGESLNQEKLLAIILYKNLFPDDFCYLHNNEGTVNEMFQRRLEHIKKEKDSCRNKLTKLNHDLELFEDIQLKNIQELRAIYILKFIEKVPGAFKIMLSAECAFKELSNDKNFEFFKNLNNIRYFHGSPTRIVESGLSFAAIEKEVDSESSYNERAKLLNEKTENKINQIRMEIESINNEINNLETLPPSKIDVDFKTDYRLDSKKNKAALIFIVSNGYLDVDFSDYTSYFYEGLLTNQDREFLISLKTHTALPFEHKLVKHVNLIKKLRSQDWEQVEILNYSLIDYVVSNKMSYQTELGIIGRYFTKPINQYKIFIQEYIINGTQLPLVISWLATINNRIWSLIPSQTTKEKLDNIFISLVNNVHISILADLKTDKPIVRFIENHENLSKLFEGKVNNIKTTSMLNNWNIKINNLNLGDGQNWISEAIYNHNLYLISSFNIEQIIKQFKPDIQISDLNQAHYTTILSSGLEKLINYIDQNIELYASQVLLSFDRHNESSATMLLLINELRIGDNIQIELLNKWEGIFSDLNGAEVHSASLIIQSNKLSCNWENILYYFKLNKKHLDEPFIDYLNNKENLKSLANQPNNLDFNSTVSLFFEEILFNSNITEKAFQILTKIIPNNYNENREIKYFEDLKPERLKFLIFKGHITFTKETLNHFIREVYKFELSERDFNKLAAFVNKKKV